MTDDKTAIENAFSARTEALLELRRSLTEADASTLSMAASGLADLCSEVGQLLETLAEKTVPLIELEMAAMKGGEDNHHDNKGQDLQDGNLRLALASKVLQSMELQVADAGVLLSRAGY